MVTKPTKNHNGHKENMFKRILIGKNTNILVHFVSSFVHFVTK